ncbi:MAG: type II secretion system protein GspN [Nitrospirae bacterium]|nr:type II secretion system protein GspN [Nitrospirota bacterium]
MKLKYIMLVPAGLLILLVLLWTVAVPVDLIRDRLESAVAGQADGNAALSVNGLRKGIFFTLYADSLDLKIDNRPALMITDFTGSFSPRYLAGKKLAFDIKGKMGRGDVSGILKLPLEGSIKTDRAELSEIPYLKRFDTGINGHVSSDMTIKDNTIKIVFNVPDLSIDDSASVVPLLNTFTKLQGALTVNDNTIHVDSISLEGEKGYARLKGSISGNVMALSLELMPVAGKLTSLESMLIGKYITSPGYYTVPINGPLPR